MVTKPERSYAGATADDRRQRRRMQLLEAAFELLAEGGREQLSKRRVSAAANLSERYFNENFESIDGLVDEMLGWQSQILAAHFTAVSAAMQADIEERTRANVQAALDFLMSDPRRIALLNLGQGHNTSQVQHRHQWAFMLATAMMSEAIKADLPFARGRRHYELASIIIAGGTIDLVTMWTNKHLGAITIDELRDIVVNLILDISNIKVNHQSH